VFSFVHQYFKHSLGPVQGGTNKCVRQSEKESGQICTSYEQSELGNFGFALKVIMHIRPLQRVLWGTRVEGYRRQITTVTLSEQVDHERKIRSRGQRSDIGKYSFVITTIQHWNQLPADVLRNLPRKTVTFKKRVRKVIIELN